MDKILIGVLALIICNALLWVIQIRINILNNRHNEQTTDILDDIIILLKKKNIRSDKNG